MFSKRQISLLVLAALMLVAGMIAMAAETPNDPRVNFGANACYSGGTLEGKCDTEYMWIAGWYLIRYEAGLIGADQMPDAYKWLLDQAVTDSAPSGPEPEVTPDARG